MNVKIWLVMMQSWYGTPGEADAFKLPKIPVEIVAYTSRPACVKRMREYREDFPEGEDRKYTCDHFFLRQHPVEKR